VQLGTIAEITLLSEPKFKQQKGEHQEDVKDPQQGR